MSNTTILRTTEQLIEDGSVKDDNAKYDAGSDLPDKVKKVSENEYSDEMKKMKAENDMLKKDNEEMKKNMKKEENDEEEMKKKKEDEEEMKKKKEEGEDNYEEKKKKEDEEEKKEMKKKEEMDSLIGRRIQGFVDVQKFAQERLNKIQYNTVDFSSERNAKSDIINILLGDNEITKQHDPSYVDGVWSILSKSVKNSEKDGVNGGIMKKAMDFGISVQGRDEASKVLKKEEILKDSGITISDTGDEVVSNLVKIHELKDIGEYEKLCKATSKLTRA